MSQLKQESINKNPIKTRGVWPCHLHKKVLIQKKNSGSSNISRCKIIILEKKNPLKETKILQDIYNSITNLKFQHNPKYQLNKNPCIKIDLLLFYYIGAKIP
jgi:hypothetical protein